MKKRTSYNGGQTSPRAKLTDHEIDLLRQCVANGMQQKQAAATFEISRAHVNLVVHWKRR